MKMADKSNYFNGHIIPQLMRFASTFSIVTEKKIREETADNWTKKIIDYIFDDPETRLKVISWIKELKKDIDEHLIGYWTREYVINAFKTNIKIMLVVDDLSAEQKETLKNVINAFKLENGEPINFLGYIVRIEQKINLVDNTAEYALSVQ